MTNENLKRIAVIPTEGKVVIDLETSQPIPKDGAMVLDNKYNRRRVLDGDLIEVENLPEKKPSKKSGQ